MYYKVKIHRRNVMFIPDVCSIYTNLLNYKSIGTIEIFQTTHSVAHDDGCILQYATTKQKRKYYFTVIAKM